jgi:hypothetical protein
MLEILVVYGSLASSRLPTQVAAEAERWNAGHGLGEEDMC